MDSSTTWLWPVVITVGVTLLLWFWARAKNGTALERTRITVQKRVRGWLNAVGQEQFVTQETRMAARYTELADRLAAVETGLTHVDQLEDWAADLRRHLRRLEEAPPQELTEHQTAHRVAPRTVVRLGVRMTLADLIWKTLGIVQPCDLPDHRIDKVLQGPFCRNCLRSLVVSNVEYEDRSIRHQCRHCSLSWRVDPESSTIPLHQFKRELYELLDAEYRRNGTIGIIDER